MVYQAVDPTIGRMVAIKTVTAVLSDDPEFPTNAGIAAASREDESRAVWIAEMQR